MITLISGSNRVDNRTVHFAKYAYEQLLNITDIPIRFLDLAEQGELMISNTMYQDTIQPTAIQKLQNTYFIPASKFWFFVPEYNGSYPGIIKLLIDAISIRKYQESFADKKSCITGIASGRAGNLRGMDHLAEVLSHLGMHVHPNKNPISSVHTLLDAEKHLIDEPTKQSLHKQAVQLTKF